MSQLSPAATNGQAVPQAPPAAPQAPARNPPAAAGVAGEREIPIAAIDPDPDQPRKEFDPERHEDMKGSLRDHSLLYAVVVYLVVATGRFRIIDGERRWRAAKDLGWATIRARVLQEPPDEIKRRELLLVCNEQRQDLPEIERGLACYDYMRLTGCSARELARKLGKNVSTITRAVKLAQNLSSSAYLRERVRSGTLPPSITQELLALSGDDARHAIAAQYPDPLKTRAEVAAAVKASKNGRADAGTAGFACEEGGVKLAVSWAKGVPDAQALTGVENALKSVLKDLAAQKQRGVTHWKNFLDKKAKAARRQADLAEAQKALARVANPPTERSTVDG